jgi:glycosyltransferase involved in cell wall biosynthesis
LNLDSLAGMPECAPGTVRVGLVATFAKWKGHEVFLRALARPELQNIRGYIVGAPIYRTAKSQYSLTELKELACELGLEDRVGFTGFVPDSGAVMRALDIVVHASTDPEPFGLAIAEAMACGRAVIATRGGAPDEMFRHFHDGFATPRGDDEALARALFFLARHPAARARLGNNARATAEARFDRDRLGRALSSIYMENVPACAYSTSTAVISTAA